MPAVIEVTYPLGFVHATPWHHHANEGVVEWPPSPWRLLRALVAVWKTRLPHLEEVEVEQVLQRLAEPPRVWVAPRTEASIRTYLPPDAHRSGQAKSDLLVDAFAAVDRHHTAVAYRWEADLDPGAQAALAELAEGMGYLGRAESVCTATARFESGTAPDGEWIEPLDDTGGEGVRTLVSAAPIDLGALCVSIGDLRRSKRLDPPGARWVRYPVGAPSVALARRVAPSRPRPVAVRIALSAPALPSRYSAVLTGEVLRRAAMSQYGAATGGRASPLLSGKDEGGAPLQGNRHAHWIPLDADDDGLLDTVLVWVADGLGPSEVEALAAVREIRLPYREGVRDFRDARVAVESLGGPGAVDLGCVFGPSAVWESVSPFVPQRHRKKEEPRAHVEDCVRRELAARGIPTDGLVVELKTGNWGAWRRYRLKERVHQQRSAYGVRLVFSEPVSGPLTLGSLSRFGLGLFGARAAGA